MAFVNQCVDLIFLDLTHVDTRQAHKERTHAVMGQSMTSVRADALDVGAVLLDEIHQSRKFEHEVYVSFKAMVLPL